MVSRLYKDGEGSGSRGSLLVNVRKDKVFGGSFLALCMGEGLIEVGTGDFSEQSPVVPDSDMVGCTHDDFEKRPRRNGFSLAVVCLRGSWAGVSCLLYTSPSPRD